VAKYQLEVKEKALKELAKVRPDTGMRLLRSIETLASDPRPRQSHKLSGSVNCYRLRVGDYRVLYQVDDEAALVTIFKIGHRREVYR
jgi:mRNA interferase RelE/StbE